MQRNDQQRHDDLAAAVQGLRDSVRNEPVVLSDRSRASIREKMAQPRRRELAPVFTPLSHWAYAAGIPAVTAIVLAATLGIQQPSDQWMADAGTISVTQSVKVYKVDGRVVFEGAGVNRIRRSDSPEDFSLATPLDRAESGEWVDTQAPASGGLVYYRIE